MTVPRATAAADPIVVVGMACRYPGGVGSPERALGPGAHGGRDAIAGFPADRGWDLDALCHPDPDAAGQPPTCAAAGSSTTRRGFDAGFFGISPREALAMDPQQRLLLEVDLGGVRAGRDRPAHRCAAATTGVFAGTIDQDYGRTAPRGTAELVDGYLGTGTAASVLVRPRLLPSRPGGARAHGRHGLLVVAGGAAPGRAGAAVRRVRRWPWPAA